MDQITHLEQLDELYAKPHPVVANKAIFKIEQHSSNFIKHSPFIMISTITPEGFPDISPRGGVPGFVKVLDETHLAIPDSPGNNRIDTLKNLLVNPSVGILFTIPGINEIVRLKGTATIHTDSELLEQCLDGDKPPKIVIKVAIQEMFFHCPKAMTKGKVWSPEAQMPRDILPSLGQIVKDQQNLLEI